MDLQILLRRFNSLLINKFLATDEKSDLNLGNPQRFLIVRQHNQFGDMLATVPLFRAIKEKYPNCHLTVMASPANYKALDGNPFVDRLFVFDKKKIFNSTFRDELKAVLKNNYDVAIVPVTVAISSTSCIFAALSDAKIKIGPRSLNGKYNSLNKLFNYRVDLNWKKYPDAHVSDFIQDIVKQFKIYTKNFTSVVSFNEKDEEVAEKFLSSLGKTENDLLIGIHVGAAKPQNRWSLDKYIELIAEIMKKYDAKIYLTGSNADDELLDYMMQNCKTPFKIFKKEIAPLAAIINKSDLFITNDTGVMHVAGTTKTPQVSLFGQTNPFNWAPVGSNKYFLRKSELVNDISVDDVLNLFKLIVKKEKV